jgi:hypothetical protein
MSFLQNLSGWFDFFHLHGTNLTMNQFLFTMTSDATDDGFTPPAFPRISRFQEMIRVGDERPYHAPMTMSSTGKLQVGLNVNVAVSYAAQGQPMHQEVPNYRINPYCLLVHAMQALSTAYNPPHLEGITTNGRTPLPDNRKSLLNAEVAVLHLRNQYNQVPQTNSHIITATTVRHSTETARPSDFRHPKVGGPSSKHGPPLPPSYDDDDDDDYYGDP